jgi:hypothetical protein
MWISVNDVNTLRPITNAYFSVASWNNGDGNYFVYVDPNQTFWSDAKGYKQQYANADGHDYMQIGLTAAVWPEE